MQHVEQAVYAAVQRVAKEKLIPLERIQDHHMLVDGIGFTSLDLARIIAIVELELDADPFASLVPITSIRTVGDLCMAYAKCFADGEEAPNRAPEADSLVARAQASTHGGSAREHQRELRKRARGEAS